MSVPEAERAAPGSSCTNCGCAPCLRDFRNVKHLQECTQAHVHARTHV